MHYFDSSGNDSEVGSFLGSPVGRMAISFLSVDILPAAEFLWGQGYSRILIHLSNDANTFDCRFAYLNTLTIIAHPFRGSLNYSC
jgi:hypothetical protein